MILSLLIQLPAEWQKFAYGQTDDQKDLTQKARNFMRCRPRVLQFERNTSQQKKTKLFYN